jgi:hypothetical protein
MSGELRVVGAIGFVERLWRWRRGPLLLLQVILVMLCGASVAQAAQDETTETKLDSSTSELLASTLEANRYWFEGPPERVPGYRYTFVHPHDRPRQFTVADPQAAEVRVKRGITYLPLVGEVIKALAGREPKVATVEAVERSDGEIRIRFRTDGSLSPRLGGGVSGDLSSYLPFRLGDGVIRLDAASLMPIEMTSVRRDERRNSETVVTETLSEPFEVDAGHWVPLHIVADVRRNTVKDEQRRPSGHDRFDWAFRVYEPGLWLFDAQLIAEGTAIGYHLEDVVIGEDEAAASRACSTAVASIRGAKELTKSARRSVCRDESGLVAAGSEEASGTRLRLHAGRRLPRAGCLRPPGKRPGRTRIVSRVEQALPFSGSQHLFTADGREVKGKADEPYVKVRALDPESTGPDAGNNVPPCLATGWGWWCASMNLARRVNDSAITIDEQPKKKTWRITTRPLHGGATFTVGTLLRYTSWACLRRSRYKRCDIEVDRESGLPVVETYFVKGQQGPFCTIRFENWLDTAEGKAPGKVVGRVTYEKQGPRDPEMHKRETFDEVFRFTGTYRVTDAGFCCSIRWRAALRARATNRRAA